MSTPSWLIKEANIQGYHPANHTGTLNRRLISRDNVGAQHVEVLIGVIEKNQGALPHAHPGIEQVCYLLSGNAIASVAGVSASMQAGDCCFFPPDLPHSFTVTSDEPARVLIIYSPPYEESPDRVIRSSSKD